MQIERNTHVVFEHTKHKKVWQVIATRIANGRISSFSELYDVKYRMLTEYHNHCTACEYTIAFDREPESMQLMCSFCPLDCDPTMPCLNGAYKKLAYALGTDVDLALQMAEQIRDWPVKDDVICR